VPEKRLQRTRINYMELSHDYYQDPMRLQDVFQAKIEISKIALSAHATENAKDHLAYSLYKKIRDFLK